MFSIIYMKQYGFVSGLLALPCVYIYVESLGRERRPPDPSVLLHIEALGRKSSGALSREQYEAKSGNM